MTQIQQVHRFDSEEVWHAVKWLDPLHTADESVEGVLPAPRSTPIVPVRGAAGRRHGLPVAVGRVLDAAAQSSFAAGRLLAGQVVTASVLGCGVVGQLMLAGAVRYVPGLSHASLYGGDARPPVVAGVIDQLDLAGVGFVPADSAAEAVRGANLVIVCDDIPLPDLRIECLSPNCVVVNASGVDLPQDLVDRVDAIYVDNLRSLDAHRHRHFVRSHLGEACADAGGRDEFGRARRRRAVRVSGDFDQLPTCRLRSCVHRVVLVELLGDDIGVGLLTPEFISADTSPAEGMSHYE